MVPPSVPSEISDAEAWLPAESTFPPSATYPFGAAPPWPSGTIGVPAPATIATAPYTMANPFPIGAGAAPTSAACGAAGVGPGEASGSAAPAVPADGALVPGPSGAAPNAAASGTVAPGLREVFPGASPTATFSAAAASDATGLPSATDPDPVALIARPPPDYQYTYVKTAAHGSLQPTYGQVEESGMEYRYVQPPEYVGVSVPELAARLKGTVVGDFGRSEFSDRTNLICAALLMHPDLLNHPDVVRQCSRKDGASWWYALLPPVEKGGWGEAV